jgi:glutamate synthase (NADPH/NADH) large chain/glutamate synthase (ferredoxin)
MLLSDQLATYYPELSDERVVSAVAFVHQRYSTNTFPTWDLAQPFRLVCHNGEINTVRGNVHRMQARSGALEHALLGDATADLLPVIPNPGGSDTASFDNALELLVAGGYDVEHALAMMMPETFSASAAEMPDDVREFLHFHSALMEPWDGPANMAAFDGRKIVACLDRNGLRPVRYWITSNDEVIYASEAGVLDEPSENIIARGRLGPGKMMVIDTKRGVVEYDADIKARLAKKNPYGEWIRQSAISWKDLPDGTPHRLRDHLELRQQQQAFAYTIEDLKVLIAPMCINGQEPVGSMGIDTPLAVLSNKSKLLYWYFKQAFAQVTNPPIDPIREEVVMSLRQYIGTAGNILQPEAGHARLLELEHPILSNQKLASIKAAAIPGLQGTTLDITYPTGGDGAALEARMDELAAKAAKAVRNGYNALVLSDRATSAERAPIPALLAVSGLNKALIRAGLRSRCSLILESAEPREVHHYAALVGYGATAINPYLAFESIQHMVDEGFLASLDGNDYADSNADACAHYVENYIKAIKKGLFKVFSKLGVSTLQSYCQAQIFEAVGLNKDFVAKYFTGTPSKIQGAGMQEIAQEIDMRQRLAFANMIDRNRELERGGEYHWRREGEAHIMHPEAIALLQHSVRANDYGIYKRFTQQIDDQSQRLLTLRGLLKPKVASGGPIPIDEVEPVEEIVKRFCTGAMSLGSISSEAHETLAIAMNRLGGKSNTGEGGEDMRRFTRDENGDWRRSHIKQVASGRFGVTPHYLVNAGEMQIKIAQGAKPGEGGQLPGHKVSDYIGKLRYSVPGVTLISPPPHHDIYSIEDLAQLIYDLKNCNPDADVTVKLVSIAGVGTVAAGVAKGKADCVIVAGYDGGTGASPLSSIKHAGVPWELGLAETHQTLILNDLRGRIRVQTDGQLRTGRDVIIATMLGAEEYAFATVALVTMGCIMMRKCHLNTCPVGIATQDDELRGKFAGDAQNVVNYFTMMAQEIREYMAEIGVRTLHDLVGRTDLLETNEAIKHWKSQGLDLNPLLHRPDVGPEVKIRNEDVQEHDIYDILDRQLIADATPALERREPVVIERAIFNYNRSACTMLSGAVAKAHGVEGLPPSTITVKLHGVAGQSFGTFLAPGIDLFLEGEGNDYVGKGQAGGRIIIRPPQSAPYQWDQNSIVGNTVLYGATGGKIFIGGRAGERFCVRNSGVTAVVEGVGDHGCEYMTGGTVVVLGETGRNFAAGMSGGFAFVFDEDQHFARRCNPGMVDLEVLDETEDVDQVKALIEEHHELTGSPKAADILAHWSENRSRFVKVFPHEFRRVLMERQQKETVNG